MPRGGTRRARSARSTSCARWSASTATTASTAAVRRASADARRRSGASPPRASPTTPTRSQRPRIREPVARRRRHRPAEPRRRARSTRSRGAASCRAGRRSGSPSSATRRSRPTRSPSRSGARRASWTERVDRVTQSARQASYSQYTLMTTCRGAAAGRSRDGATWQSGLRFADGRRKPGVYRAFALPLPRALAGRGRRRGLRRRARAESARRRAVEAKAPARQLPFRRHRPREQARLLQADIPREGGLRQTFRVTLATLARAKQPGGP